MVSHPRPPIYVADDALFATKQSQHLAIENRASCCTFEGKFVSTPCSVFDEQLCLTVVQFSVNHELIQGVDLPNIAPKNASTSNTLTVVELTSNSGTRL